MALRVTALAIFFAIANSAFPVHAAEKHAVPVGVKRVLMDPVSNSPVVILEAIQKHAIVPIWIGTSEAASIALELEQKKLPRPNSHDLIRNLLSALDAKVDRVTITELRDSTYFAIITLKVGARELHIDARPSDAIAVALRAAAPIYAAPDVLRQGVGSPRESLSATNTVRQIMGFHIQDMTTELADLLNSPRAGGVLVAHVELDSLASRLGFERGDVITRVDQRRIRNTGELEQAFSSRKGARKINFQVQRKGRPITIVVDLPS
jgi:uncharacterized protein